MSSHGHVVPNADGSRARCGGPGLCAVCSREAAQELPRLRAELAKARAERDALRADAERLEWLDAHPREGSIRIGGDIKSVVFWGVSATPGTGLRSAIDAARAEGER